MGSIEMTQGTIERQGGECVGSDAGLHACALARRVQYDEDNCDWRDVTTRLYGQLRLALYRYLRGLGLSLDAEDAIQETFFRLVRHLQNGNKIENVQAWVFQVAYNISMDIHRASRRGFPEMCEDVGCREKLADYRSNPEWVYLQKEEVRRVRTALSRLTPRQFRSVQLRVKGLRYRDIAADLCVSEQRAIHLVKRALVRLAQNS